MGNMSAIYEYLGASESQLPLLWLAAPLTGLIVQPIIGHMSDRTWGPLGRRRPYFLTGAILASLALLAMPHSGVLWMAAGLLWILDASVNISMEPFRAFVADLLPEQQRTVGFAMQSAFIGAGAVIASKLPGWLQDYGISIKTDVAHPIPRTVVIAFTVGAVVFLASVLWTIVTTKEYPPEDLEALRRKQGRKPGPDLDGVSRNARAHETTRGRPVFHLDGALLHVDFLQRSRSPKHHGRDRYTFRVVRTRNRPRARLLRPLQLRRLHCRDRLSLDWALCHGQVDSRLFPFARRNWSHQRRLH